MWQLKKRDLFKVPCGPYKEGGSDLNVKWTLSRALWNMLTVPKLSHCVKCRDYQKRSNWYVTTVRHIMLKCVVHHQLPVWFD